MAETEEKSSSGVPWMPLLAVVAAVVGLTALLPSRSARPPAPNAVDTGEVSARLWQDPLSVAREHAAQSAGKPGGGEAPDAASRRGGTRPAAAPGKPAAPVPHSFSVEKLAEVYAHLYAANGGRKPIVLVGCEQASPYAEDVERRLRDRAGVIHALAAENYLPEESTSLHYARLEEASQVVPYETFHHLARTTHGAVLVVWLADGVLDPDKRGLLHQLARLAGLLTQTHGLIAEAETPELRVLGPSNSAQYRLMLEGLDGVTPGDGEFPLANLRSTRVYSCRASAPDAVLRLGIDWLAEVTGENDPEGHLELSTVKLRDDRASLNEVEKVLHALHATGFHFQRTIPTDLDLTKALWNELKARGVKVSDPVAVIADLDSVYGRSTAWAFLEACRRARGKQKLTEQTLAKQ